MEHTREELPEGLSPTAKLILDTLKHFPDGLTEEQVHWIVQIRMEEENARLREALAVYADPDFWLATQGADQEYLYCESIGQKTYVQGKRARAALEGKE